MSYKVVKIRKEELRLLIENLRKHYLLIGPVIDSGVIILREIDYDDLPLGFEDFQSAGHYRIDKKGDSLFSFSNGPDSFKRFLYPPIKDLFEFKRTKKGLIVKKASHKEDPMAFFGIRACDIQALKILKKVFSGLENTSGYIRDDLFLIGVNCLNPGQNCFCQSLGSGPEIKNSCDIIITELKEGLLIETNTDGLRFLEGIYTVDVGNEDLKEKRAVIDQCKDRIKRSIKIDDLPQRFYKNLEHPQWSQVSERCLACGNCTQVCPSCFCNSTFDTIAMQSLKRSFEGISGKRIRVWDSCFSINFARVHGGNFRPSRRARYRHWLSHKFGYWIDQFGVIGCVGCGRCITWCPVGIDITEELEALR